MTRPSTHDKKWQIVLTGDVMLDGVLFYKSLSQKSSGMVVSNDFVMCKFTFLKTPMTHLEDYYEY
jgi:hypothetical protein